MTKLQQASGCLFGLAIGDALAAPTEFLDIAGILRKFPPNGPQELVGAPAFVTDDTQMAIAVGEALLMVAPPYTAANFEPALRQKFIEWYDSPDNNRAPGNTCLKACAGLKAGQSWLQATVLKSKGCGANMRVAPVALLPDVSLSEIAALAQFQAALTHAHPTALAASDLTALAIKFLRDGTEPGQLPARLREYATSQREVYHADWLGELWQEWGADNPASFIRQGWDDCLGVLDRVDTALANPDYETDPCLQTGAGWIAEEAFATGLLCFLLYLQDPLAGVRRAAVTSGDSDSIACLTGAFAGAYHGLSVWPDDWLARIEYRDQLTRLGQTWD